MKIVSLHGQLTFDEMKGSIERLPNTNRWVQMGDSLPWTEYEKATLELAQKAKNSLTRKESGSCKVPERTLSCPYRNICPDTSFRRKICKSINRIP